MLKEAFPGKGRVLWRDRGNHILVLTNCKLEPKLTDSDLIDSIGKLADVLAGVTNPTPFNIRLNASKRSQGKRVALSPSEISSWVGSKLNNIGITTSGVRIVNEGKLLSRRKGAVNTHNSVDVGGVLEINDRKAFIENLTLGIGHAKAYGFGLLDVFAL
jgi:CRISPR-associated protein Cas6/Cse3/CasE subtype I-E